MSKDKTTNSNIRFGIVFKKFFKTFYDGIRLLATSPQKLTANQILLRTLYARFGAIAAFIVVTGIGACILLAMPQMLLVSLVGVIAFIGYISYMEWLSESGNLLFCPVTCTGLKKVQQLSVKSVYTYRFVSIDPVNGVGFTLNRTEELGFMEGSNYLFCFKKTPDGQLDNQSMVHYIELTGAVSSEQQQTTISKTEKSTSDGTEPKEDTHKTNVITMESIRAAAKAGQMRFDDADTDL